LPEKNWHEDDMTRALDHAEAAARKVHEEWIETGKKYAAMPGASFAMFEIDQQMTARIAEAFEVECAPAAAFYTAWTLACTRSALDASFGAHAFLMPWLSPDLRELALNRTTERASEAAITLFRSRSRLS
jgi:hypothetical protein